MSQITPDELRANLSMFTGTAQWFYNPLYPDMKYTDGIKYLAETAGCYWLLDIIGTEYNPKQVKGEYGPFLAIRLNVANDTMSISVEDGNYNVYETKFIPFTDFPEGDWMLYMEDGVLLLPSEH